ncbi:MAG: tRNA pseudouridine(38-40) synthase TruA [Omnitrophica bacterium RIFCSPHIGHO2_02_FULL_49_9]|nr:MAG: tRNA pseudouridine(38-40) synthase TruA [Omnitrophica bacterium RIFCSPHIGHO2_02_FULL_49_9]OGW88300.1 MAG: tRNA pseudouridine(38-40) synthase TruA [Omnitrophica bacterium RIFCSPLOWO2_01_FULL_50_24]
MRTFRLTLEYDGTCLNGFQCQPNCRTVQGELQRALGHVFQRKIKAVGSGRTDSGAHAEGQTVHIKLNTKIPPDNIKRALNHYLPQDISVVDVQVAPPKFHAQFSARWKTYQYRVLNADVRSPLARFRAYFVPYPLKVAAMKHAARSFVGRHDFRAFESSGGRRKNAVRTIRKLTLHKQGSMMTFTVEANGFLYKMVRSLVGTLLEVGRGRLSIQKVSRGLRLKNRKLMGPTAPAHGLTLLGVTY